jgi:uncharacterized membrane protein YphA (DoxX/SURF4 family)
MSTTKFSSLSRNFAFAVSSKPASRAQIDELRRSPASIKAISYWTTTGVVAFVLSTGGAAQLLQRPDNVDGLVHLGYPVYLGTILGFWKVLGAVALLVPRFPRLKEWAYAGCFFELTGAAASHALCGDGAGYVIGPLVFAALAVASWALRPQSRTLEVHLPAKT